tara:strand:+ start:16 stop:942 length:927 start_codon:yes stop_codon:yes gene_type:complete
MNKETMDKIGLSKYLENGVIKTPDNCTKICVDVGLSETAPNSAVWMKNDPRRCVVGIEPLEYNWGKLNGTDGTEEPSIESVDGKELEHYGTDFTAGYPAIRTKSQSVYTTVDGTGERTLIKDKFYGLQCAIDNIDTPEEKLFYHMNEEGSSSLLKPSEKHESSIKKIEKIQCVNLNSILSHIDWEKFKFIEHLKIDCEGHDLEVIKSAEDYLERIVFITYEMSTHNEGHWEGHYNFEDSKHYLTSKGFVPIRYDGGNMVCFNAKLLEESEYDFEFYRIGYIRHRGDAHTPFVINKKTSTVYYADVLFE